MASICLELRTDRLNVINRAIKSTVIPTIRSKRLFGRNGWKKIVEDLIGGSKTDVPVAFFEGYTFAEITKKLGQSFSNVRNHHYRGLLGCVRKHLAKDELSGR